MHLIQTISVFWLDCSVCVCLLWCDRPGGICLVRFILYHFLLAWSVQNIWIFVDIFVVRRLSMTLSVFWLLWFLSLVLLCDVPIICTWLVSRYCCNITIRHLHFLYCYIVLLLLLLFTFEALLVYRLQSRGSPRFQRDTGRTTDERGRSSYTWGVWQWWGGHTMKNDHEQSMALSEWTSLFSFIILECRLRWINSNINLPGHIPHLAYDVRVNLEY